jgi:3-phenylpropionate/cinnamic acid dioxygenase small subunit
VQAVAAELEIRNALVRLAHLADGGGADAYLDLLTDDVVWSMPANPAVGLAASERRGHDEIRRGITERTAAGLQGPGSGTMHLVTTSWVRVDDDAHATAHSNFMFLANCSTAPEVKNVGRYDDSFRRTADGWKLARRIIRFG